MPNQLTPEQASTMQGQLATAKSQLLSIQKGMQSLPGIDMSKAPALPIDTTNIMAGVNGNITQGTGMVNQVNTALANPPKQDTSSKSIIAQGLDYLKQNKPAPIDTTALREQTMASFGQTPQSFAQIQNYVGQLASVQADIAKLEDQKATDLGNTEIQYSGYLSDIYTGVAAAKERMWNSRIAAKSTVAGMISQQYSMAMGLYQQAADMTKDIVAAATYDQEQKVEDFRFVFDTYKDLFTMMSTEENNEWQKSFDTAKFEYQQKQDEVSNKLNQEQLAVSWYNATHKEAPSSYQEWSLAGGEQGTGKTYGEFLEGTTFSKTQLNKGAANANLQMKDFARLDTYTQNFFINNSSEIEDRKKKIDEDSAAGADPTETEKEISESNAPPAVKDALIKYLWTVFPRPTAGGKHWYKPSTW